MMKKHMMSDKAMEKMMKKKQKPNMPRVPARNAPDMRVAPVSTETYAPAKAKGGKLKPVGKKRPKVMLKKGVQVGGK